MSVLGDLLNAKEPLFSESLKELAVRSGRPAADAQLTAELATKSAAALAELDFSVQSEAKQVYAALLEKIASDNKQLAALAGAESTTSLPELTPKLIRLVASIDMPRRCLALKPEVAANMLRKHPPSGMLKRLGYKSVDELLAHEDIAELFVALRFSEGSAGLEAFDATYKALQPVDFETRDIQMVTLDADKWGDVAAEFVAKKLHNITHSKEMGVIGVVPFGSNEMKGAPLKMLPLLLHYHNEIRLYSAYFKLIRSKKNFGAVLSKTLIADTPKLTIHAGHHVHWRVIQRYYGKLGKEKHPEIFEPHVQPEDLHWRAAEDVLYELDPNLGFWRGLDYVGTKLSGGVITFNLMDLALGYSNDVPFEDRYLYHFRESLWNEIFARYMGSDVLRQQILDRLDNEIIKPEEL